jgi:putative tryptophan/tyrosine transport system substrate-binding protein
LIFLFPYAIKTTVRDTMKRIIVLNSYTLSGRDAFDMVRVKYFFDGLKEEGYIKGNNLEVDLIDSNDLNVIEEELGKNLHRHTDLIHAVGSPNAALAAKITSTIPIVYYGAHPEGVGIEECQKPNTCGMTLSLPFTSHYKNFRFIKKIIPSIQRVYVPFYQNTLFCHQQMKTNYDVLRNRYNNKSWLPMDSEYIGYKSLAGLCYIIGIQYFEFLYRDIHELNYVLNLMEREGSVIMPYNDSVYCKDAPKTMIETSLEKRIPLLWNNNPEAIELGALAAVASSFEEAGFTTGKMAGQILNGNGNGNGNRNGTTPSKLGYRPSTRSYAGINLKSAARFGLDIPQNVLEYFTEIINRSDNRIK